MNVTSTPKAPAAIGPYSQAVSANGFLFTSGQIAERLGKSPKSVDNALQRTRKKVINYLWK